MKVNALDHVNIITSDLRGTVNFYVELFGLEARNAPPPLTPETAQWIYDGDGRAILHINSLDCPRAYQRDVVAGPTGSIHHVALNCCGFEELIQRLDGHHLERQINVIEAVGLRQVFTLDPNGVLLELNFWQD